MTEYTTIKLKVLRAPDDDITCRTVDEYCKFYRTIRWGQSEICNYTDKLIERKTNTEGVPDLGYTVVTEGCPMKNKEVSMRFYGKTPNKGHSYLKKSFAWFPTEVNGATVWFEYYWHYMYWNYLNKKYQRAQFMTKYNKLLENHNEPD